jgi:hypothetical protein
VDNDNVSGTRLVVNTLFELDDGNNNSEPPQPPPELPPLDVPRHHAQINAAESNRGEEATPRPLPFKTKYKYWQNKLFLQIHYFVLIKHFIGTIW